MAKKGEKSAPRLRGSVGERRGGRPSECYVCEKHPKGEDMFKLVRKAVGYSGYGKIEATFCGRCWVDIKMLIDAAKEKWHAK